MIRFLHHPARMIARASGRRLRLKRTPRRALSPVRILRGGRLADAGRMPRYLWLLAIGAAAIWGPIAGYLATAPLRYESSMSLILPGAGASASVNLDQIGQASSSAPSPFASAAVSPTETYKRLLAADRILAAASRNISMSVRDFGAPKIRLIDQTGMILLDITGTSPEDAQARGRALLQAFFSEIDALRRDEQARRNDSETAAIAEYQHSVAATRAEVSRQQRETGLISSQQYAALVSEADRLQAELSALEVQHAEKAQIVAALAAKLGLSADLAAAALKLQADAEYAALVAQMPEASAALSAARADFGPDHPQRRAAEERVVTARARVRAQAAQLTGLAPPALDGIDMTHVDERTGVLSALVTAAAEERGLAARGDGLRGQVAAARQRVRDLQEAAARLEDGERNFRVAETVLASAVARSKTAKADFYASYPLVQVLEDPALPQKPSSPRRMLAIAAGAAATLFLCIGLGLSWVRRPLIDRILAPAPAGVPA